MRDLHAPIKGGKAAVTDGEPAAAAVVAASQTLGAISALLRARVEAAALLGAIGLSSDSPGARVGESLNLVRPPAPPS